MRAALIRSIALLGLAAGSLSAAEAGAAETCEVPAELVALVESSLETKKSLTVYLNGQSIPLLVTKAGECTVEGRNQEFSRIVIRLDRVNAAAQP